MIPVKIRKLLAIAPMTVLPMGAQQFMQNGVAIGGQAGPEQFSLLRVERASVVQLATNALKSEKIKIVYGAKNGLPLKDQQPGYFHAKLDRNGHRLTLDLAQVSRSAFERRDLEKVFSQSKLVSSLDFVMDPQDGSTHLLLRFRQKIEAHLSTAKAEVDLEIRPISVDRKL